MEDVYIIHTDGGSRGNPGPAACGFVIEKNEKEIYRGSKFLGETTNNIAEYEGVVAALRWLEKNSSTIFFLDSELVVKQLNGIYKVKNDGIRKLFSQVKKLQTEKNIKAIYKNVPRSRNKIADLLVNKELDFHI